jgi:hypothetical protein
MACKSLDPPQGACKSPCQMQHVDRHGAACVCWGPGVLGRPSVFLAREPRAGAGADKKKCPRPSNLRLTNRLDAWLFVTLTILFSMRFTLKTAKSD